MKILHITPDGNGYEEVTLLANKHSERNHLAVIEKDGQHFVTGGFLIEDNKLNRQVLNNIRKSDQYDFIKSLRTTPFVKEYFQTKKEFKN